MSKICLIGKIVADNLFPEQTNVVGQTIRINNIPLIIVGIFSEKGQGSFG